jgi:hypothetical protein
VKLISRDLLGEYRLTSCSCLRLLDRQTRGSIRAMGSVRQGGAGVVTASAKEYARENSSRLGSAAGSTVGLMAGAALLGPVGLVAGAVMGAKAGAHAFRNSQKSQASDSSAASRDAPADLLDDTFVAAPPLEAFSPHPIDNFATMLPSHQSPQHQQQMTQHQPPQLQREAMIQRDHWHPPQQAIHRPQQLHPGFQQQAEAPAIQGEPQHQQQQQQSGYKFGDISRRIIAKGKEKDGRSGTKGNAGYKFEDFTRGLFK